MAASTDVSTIRNLHGAGHTYREIHADTGLSLGTISKVLRAAGRGTRANAPE